MFWYLSVQWFPTLEGIDAFWRRTKVGEHMQGSTVQAKEKETLFESRG